MLAPLVFACTGKGKDVEWLKHTEKGRERERERKDEEDQQTTGGNFTTNSGCADIVVAETFGAMFWQLICGL